MIQNQFLKNEVKHYVIRVKFTCLLIMHFLKWGKCSCCIYLSILHYYGFRTEQNCTSHIFVCVYDRHVHGFIEELGQGIQHIASRVDDLPAFVQRGNDFRKITGEVSVLHFFL